VSSASEERGPGVGSLTRITHQWVLAQVYAYVTTRGFEDLGRSQVGMFRYPTLDGLRPSELAERLQSTKQSVNDLVGEMEERGYLIRVPDDTDGRARVIRLTAEGRRLEQTAYEGARTAERAIIELLGPRRFAQLKRSLEEIVSHISEGDLDSLPAAAPTSAER
jgi:DNA-binding MarR family transcriptional regulator